MTAKQRLGRFIFKRMPITRFLFDQLRIETNAGLRRIENTVLPGKRRRLTVISRERDLRVNIACGPSPLDSFVNLDLMPSSALVIGWDCRRSLPLSSGSAVGIRVEHFLEHLETREELPQFLADCMRVLAPGGILRVIVPDAGRFLSAYADATGNGFRSLGFAEKFPDDLPTRMDVINHVFHQWSEHRWGYDFENLAHRLASAGYREIVRKNFGESADPLLGLDRPVHAPYSLYVEAKK